MVNILSILPNQPNKLTGLLLVSVIHFKCPSFIDLILVYIKQIIYPSIKCKYLLLTKIDFFTNMEQSTVCNEIIVIINLAVYLGLIILITHNIYLFY